VAGVVVAGASVGRVTGTVGVVTRSRRRAMVRPPSKDDEA
jgi:hypothetical protein